MRQDKTLAIVLRRTNFGEADRIVNFITPAGKVVGIARGARKQKSKLAGGIEVFALNEIVLMKGKNEMKTIISARMREFFGEIIKDLDRTEFGYFAIKKISSLSEHIDSADFFDILLKTFVSLNDLSIDLGLIRSWFILQANEAIGEELNLEIDSFGDSLSPDKRYDFDVFDKVFIPNENGEFSANHIKFLRLMLSSEPRIISKVKGGSQILRDIREVFFRD
jgi:DNA repair protein recO